MKSFLTFSIGVVGSFIASLLGGWDTSIITLLIFLAIDYLTGLLCAGVFHKSNKSETGGLESKAGWKGLIRKGLTISIVVVAARLDLQLGVTYIRDAVCIAFISNEAISIIENCGLMGLPIPKIIRNGIDILKKSSDSEQSKNNVSEELSKLLDED